MGRADHLILGDWNVVCYQCGFKRKASMMEKNWQGYYVCPEHNEPRQTQDFVRAIPDNQTVPWSQPTPPVIYTYDNVNIGWGDGHTTQFQLGSGLYPVTVTEVRINGFVNPAWHANFVGLITILFAPFPLASISASGTERVS